ncbi:MAG: hypothetical protein LBM04_11255 [Opitutaceae bacterium]|nr:hypothetical protein [Opitutaceae bacterium]
MIVAILWLFLLAATSCQQQPYKYDFDSTEKQDIVFSELFKIKEIFRNETDASKVESSLVDAINYILEMRSKYKKRQK